MLYLLRLSFALFVTLLSAGLAHAEKRVALIVGNSAYQYVEKLKNPINDAARLAEKLKSMGFDKVALKQNLTGNELRSSLGQFARDAAGADIAVLYFAGHGIEVGGRNYVIPTDAKLLHIDDVDFEAIQLGTVIRALNRARKLKLVILDACRDNPFKASLSGTGGNRSVGRGLARISPSGSDTLVAYAAKEGTVAADGTGDNSPYAEALVEHIATPGLDVRILFGRVRDAVLEATGHKQEPFTYGSLPGHQIFLKAQPATKPQPIAQAPRLSNEAVFWNSVKDSTEPALVEEFLKHFPESVFAGIAKIKLAKLQVRQQAVGPVRKEKGQLPKVAATSPSNPVSKYENKPGLAAGPPLQAPSLTAENLVEALLLAQTRLTEATRVTDSDNLLSKENRVISEVRNRREPSVNINIEFEFGSHRIKKGSIVTLDTIGRALTSNDLAGQDFLIVVHTDAAGSRSYNEQLSLHRANAVVSYLLSHFSLDRSRISAEGAGEDQPLDRSDPYGQVNRRVEVRNVTR